MFLARFFRAAALAAWVGTAFAAHAEQGSPAVISVVQKSATSLTLSLENVANLDERGAVGNAVYDVFVGAGARIFSLQWDINVTSYPGSYLSEMQLTFSDTAGNGVTFTPGSSDEFDGTMSYAGFQDLRPAGQDFSLGADGVLRLEFHDAYKDLGFDEPEGIWNQGTLSFGVSAVPEPGTCALVACGLILVGTATHRRRRAAMAQSLPASPAFSIHHTV